MLALDCKISLGPNANGDTFSFQYVTEIEGKESWKDLTDTCHIKLPRNVGNYGTGRLDAIIYRGMKVKFEYGYVGEAYRTFTGYIASIKPTIPVEVICEDEMFLFKNLVVKPKSFVRPSLSDILDYCNVGSVMPYTTLGDVTLSDFLIDKKMGTAARVFQALKDDLKIYTFIRNGKLVVGQPYDASGNARVVNFEFGQNIEDTGSLQYMDEKDIRIQLEAISKRNTGKDLKVTVGDSDGDKRTRYYYNVTDLASLTKMANRDVACYKYSGYRGKFKAFGIPLVEQGDIVSLSDPDFKDHDGKYYVDAVFPSFGEGGIRQHIELGPLADSVYKFTSNE